VVVDYQSLKADAL
jgi:hypothetical protein